MEYLPRGANFKRAKVLWELGLHIASEPATPYGGNRDMCIAVGSGSGEGFKPSLKLATGSAILAHAVAKGDIDMAFVNPSAMLTQAYRGVGLFTEQLPLRIIGSYPELRSLRHRDAREPRLPVARRRQGGPVSAEDLDPRGPDALDARADRAAVRGLRHDVSTTSTSWGGTIQRVGGPARKQRLDGLRAGTLDAVFDEGIRTWLAVGARGRPERCWSSRPRRSRTSKHSAGGAWFLPKSAVIRRSPPTTLASTSAAGRCTRARRYPIRSPTTCAPRFAARESRDAVGRSRRTPVSRRSSTRPTRHRWTCRCIPARLAGTPNIRTANAPR